MKKVITLCLFVFALFLGTQTTVAQNSKIEINKEINAKAATKTEALRKHIKFDKEQRNEIYSALKAYEQSKVRISNNPVSEDEKAKIEKQLNDKIKKILSEEQFERYLTFE
ncbi:MULTISPECIES: hypothetical protein [Winogradskyella]|uniref:Uncharacterized protein n=1 Tax=Winogradskyella damuponensis TaxID=943939 RepID=A0ABP8CWJ5_9FLAO